jgi:AcrR family transcriptional regulator
MGPNKGLTAIRISNIMTKSHIMNTGQNRKTERRKSEQLARRTAILKAAREVFFAKGFMNATIDEIAERCGLAKGTIYLYFKSKEELYVSIMAEGMGRLRKEFEALRKHRPGEKYLVENAFRTYYGFYLRNKKYFRIMFLSSHPDVRARVPEALLVDCMEAARECLGIVRDLIQEGIENHYYRKVDAWAVANILWATVNGIVMSFEQDPQYREEIVGMKLEQMLLHSLDLALQGLRA